jgi:hypothetical protein
MIFKVSKKVKGTLVLKSIKHPLRANSIITIKGDHLYEDDIQAAIRAGVLTQQTNDGEEEYVPASVTPRVTITNNLNKRLVLGELTLAANGSTYISRKDIDEDVLRRAAAAKYISIVFDEEIEENYNNSSVDISDDFDEPEAHPTVWDFNEEALQDAPQVPTSKNAKIKEMSEEEDGEEEEQEEETVVITKNADGNVVIKEEEVVIPVKKKVAQKKEGKRLVSKKKVSVSKSKKKDKTLVPSGEVRPPKTQADAAVELDSRGKPIGPKPGETLQDLINDITGDDISFVDKEQDIERLRNKVSG